MIKPRVIVSNNKRARNRVNSPYRMAETPRGTSGRLTITNWCIIMGKQDQEDSLRSTGQDVDPSTEHLTRTNGAQTQELDKAPTSAPVSLPSDNQVDASLPTPMQDGLESPLTDMDCPICFSAYNISRVPKRLTCNHDFCSECLKHLIRNETERWVIVCPICRAPTSVFGGLVCTLKNQESLMSRLENHEASLPTKSAGPSQRPDFICSLEVVPQVDVNEESRGNTRVAAQRVVSLCLILLIVLLIIFQFVYGGIMKWVLGSMLGVVAILSVLLCLNPNCSVKQIERTVNAEKDNYAISSV